jgi:hypothetical protein
VGVNRIVLVVDRLVLRGVADEHRDVVAEALRTSLAAALADPSAVSRIRALGQLDALRVPAPSAGDGSPAALGRAAADAVAGRLVR